MIEPAARKARSQAMRRLPQLLARIDWPRKRLDAHRLQMLREVLSHAIRQSPWHRERLGDIDPATFRLKDLPSLPTMTKQDLMGGFDHISTDPRITLERCEEHIETGELLLDGDLVVVASGGSSGVRAVNVERIGPLAEAWMGGMPRFVMRWGMRTRGIPRRVVPWAARIRRGAGPPAIAGIGAPPGPHASSLFSRLFAGAGRGGFSVLDPLHEIVAGLNELRPTHLVAYASFLPRLLEQARQGRLHIRPRVVSPVAEPLLPEHEQAVEEAWGSTVISIWGATEAGPLGVGSGFESGMLLLDDVQIVEPVDAEGCPVQAGRRADKIFVTPLRCAALPIIRYEITDQLTVLAEPAACGSSFTRIANVEGRLDDEFVYQGGVAVDRRLFSAVLGQRRSITEYQVEQTTHGATIRTVLAEGAAELDRDRVIEEIRDHLATAGLRDAEISLEDVSKIPRHTHSLKLRRFVPLSATPVAPRTHA